jgi:hypothetical protein
VSVEERNIGESEKRIKKGHREARDKKERKK